MMRRTIRTASVLGFAGASAWSAGCGLDATVLRSLDFDAAQPVLDAGGDRPPDEIVPVPPAGNVFDVALGQYHSCALGGSIAFCFGANEQGQLGTGDVDNRLTPAIARGGIAFDNLSAGEGHTCGVEHGTSQVHCWGDNRRGQLGVGDENPRLVPTHVPLPGPVAAMSAGYQHTCAILTSGELHCWGDDDEGQLGVGSAAPSGPLENVSPTRVGTDSDWTAIAGGQGHSCGLRGGGQLFCWGRNVDGELAIGSVVPGQTRVPTAAATSLTWTSVDVGQDQGCAIATDGSLYCFGLARDGNLDGSDSQLLVVTRIGSDSDWTSISVDVFSTCGVRRGGKLMCWGRNVEGQLGLGDNAMRTAPTEVEPGTLWDAVSVGRFHMCAMTTERVFRCAGANPSGELGSGNTDRQNTLSPVSLPLSSTRGF